MLIRVQVVYSVWFRYFSQSRYALKAYALEIWSHSCPLLSASAPWHVTACGLAATFTLLFPLLKVARGVADGKLRPMLAKDVVPLMSELIQACWADGPSVRPAFGQITARLRQIIADVDNAGKHHSDHGADGHHEHHGVLSRLFHKSS